MPEAQQQKHGLAGSIRSSRESETFDLGGMAAGTIANVIQHGARSIGRVRYVRLATSQFPDQKRIDSTKKKITIDRPRPCAVNMI